MPSLFKCYHFSGSIPSVICPLLPSPATFLEGFGDSSLLAYTHTGYNAMSGDLHAKRYYQEDGLCATVIRHLRVLGPSRTMTLMG